MLNPMKSRIAVHVKSETMGMLKKVLISECARKSSPESKRARDISPMGRKEE
jgi:hypothetical protein